MMHEPSAEADMHSESSALMEMKLTGPRCSFIEAIITCVSLATAHTRTMPSAPPLSSRLQSLEQQTAVTPFLGVSPPEELPTW